MHIPKFWGEIQLVSQNCQISKYFSEIMNKLFFPDFIATKYITILSFQCFLLHVDWIFRPCVVIISVRMVKYPIFMHIRVEIVVRAVLGRKFKGNMC